MKAFNVISRLSQLVSIDSQSSKDNTPLIDLLTSWFSNYDCKLQEWVRKKDQLHGQNLLVKIPGISSEAALVFVAHIDTVPQNTSWNTDPFQLTEEDGKLYGLGTCDTKGGTAALIDAVSPLKTKPRYDTYLIFDGDEEDTTAGAKRFLEDFSISKPHIIFIEPTEKELHIGQRSILKFDITTYGKATHSSQATPENNDFSNAIYKMHKILAVLAADAHKLAKDCDPLFGMSTQNFGMIHGGTARNVFANICTLVIERRLLPSIDPMREFERLEILLKNIDKKAKIVLDDALPSFSTSKDSGFAYQSLKSMQAIIPSSKFGIFPAWSEAGLFAHLGEVLVLGPGSIIDQAHQANEYIEKKELMDFVKIYRKIIEDITFA